MRSRAFGGLAVTSLCLPFTLAMAGAAHEHGKGHVDIAVEPAGLSLSLRLPADSTVGFERAPATAAERAQVAAVTAWLEAGGWLPLQPAEACGQPDIQLSVPAQQSTTTETARHDHDHTHHDAHIDWHVDIAWRCDDPEALEAIDFSPLFAHLRRLESLQVQHIDAHGQYASTVTAAQPRLTLRQP